MKKRLNRTNTPLFHTKTITPNSNQNADVDDVILAAIILDVASGVIFEVTNTRLVGETSSSSSPSIYRAFFPNSSIIPVMQNMIFYKDTLYQNTLRKNTKV